MKITAVEAILLKGQSVYGSHDTADEVTDQGDWQMLIRVTTDEGLTGWSDCETLSSAAVPVVNGDSMGMLGFQTLSDILVGENPLDVERLWDKMYLGSSYHGRRGLALQCLSAVDNCLWSIRSQAAGMPIHQLLGGARRDRVTAYASTLFRDSPEANAAAATHYAALGFHAVKFGWGVFGEDTGRDVEILTAIREALGPDRHLLIDPGWYGAGWKTRDPYALRTRRENIELCERVAAFNPTWIEDFIHPERYEEYAYVRERSPVKVAAGEQVATSWDFDRFVGGECVDIIQPDLTRCGGLSVASHVAQLAVANNILLVPHSWLSDLLHAYSLHLIATLPRALFLEFNIAQSDLTRGICGGAMKLNADGTVSVPQGLGAGVEVDEDFVRSHRVN